MSAYNSLFNFVDYVWSFYGNEDPLYPIGAEKVAESYTKVMTADFVLSMSRKIEDKAANTARCHIIKNRFGVDGITYPVSMNTTIGLIDIHRPTSKMGSEATKKMKSSEDFLRQTAANV